MSVRLKPHTLTLSVASATMTGYNVATGVDHDLTGQTVRGQVTPLTPETGYKTFGVDLKRPHMLMCDISELNKFNLNDWWILGSRTFRVATEPQIWDAETATSCLVIGLEELE